MRKKHQGILCIIIGLVFLMSFWVLASILVTGRQDDVIQHPHGIPVSSSVAYFLLFGGIGLIIFGILRLVQTFLIHETK